MVATGSEGVCLPIVKSKNISKKNLRVPELGIPEHYYKDHQFLDFKNLGHVIPDRFFPTREGCGRPDIQYYIT
jgi:hypothetical protein